MASCTKVPSRCGVCVWQQEAPQSEESDESFNSDDEAMEEQIMEQLQREAEAEAEADRLHELTINEEDLARQVSIMPPGSSHLGSDVYSVYVHVF